MRTCDMSTPVGSTTSPAPSPHASASADRVGAREHGRGLDTRPGRDVLVGSRHDHRPPGQVGEHAAVGRVSGRPRRRRRGGRRTGRTRRGRRARRATRRSPPRRTPGRGRRGRRRRAARRARRWRPVGSACARRRGRAAASAPARRAARPARARRTTAWSTPRRRRAASVTFVAFSVQTSGRKRPVASAKPATAPVASAVGRSLIVYTVPDVPIETATSPGRSPTPERGGHVVARARGDDGAPPLPGPIERTEDLGHDGRPVAVAVDDAEQVEPVGACRRRPVAGARGVATIGDEAVGEAERQPVMGQHDVGETLPRRRLLAVQPRQLGDREAGHGHRAARRRPRRRATVEVVEQPRRVGRRLGVVPQLGRADHLAGRRRGRPCRAAGRRRRSPPPVALPASDQAPSNASHQPAGSCSDRGGCVGWCGRDPRATTRPSSRSRISTLVALVDESTPATSVNGEPRVRVSERQRASGQQRPAWPGNASRSRAVEVFQGELVEVLERHPALRRGLGVELLGAQRGDRLAVGQRGDGQLVDTRVAQCLLDLGVAAERRRLGLEDQVVAHARSGRHPDPVDVLRPRRLEVEVPGTVVAAGLEDVDGPERAARVAGAEAQVLVVRAARADR